MASSTAVAAENPNSPDVVNIAHRGSSGAAPENTVAAVEHAVRQGAPYVEVDVQRSADGELVIMHDVTLARTTNAEEIFPDRAPWNVGDFTMGELRELDAGSWFSPDCAGEPVPTLRDVVDALRPHAGMLLEVKSPSLYPGIEAEIDAELSSIPGYLASALRTDRLVVQSFDIGSMRTLDGLAPQIPVGLLYGYQPSDEELAEASTWAEQINPSRRVTGQALVDKVHENGMTISVYTINDGQTMREYINLGVDGIITNYPGVLRDILDHLGETIR